MPFDPANNPLNAYEWVFPTLEVVHISCFAASVGLISVVNLRLAGVAFPQSTAEELNKKLFLWTLGGLTLVLVAGMMLFTMDPLRYYYNSAFRFKMLALLIAMVFQYTVHGSILRRRQDGSYIAILSAAVCTMLWASVCFGGIFFAFAD